MPDTRRNDEEHAAPFIWRLRPWRLALVAIPVWPAALLLCSGFTVTMPMRALVAAMLVVSFAAPAAGLLAVALLAPLGQLIAALIGDPNFRVGEMMVLAFLIGWLLRGEPDRRGPGVSAPAAGWLFSAAIVASIAGLAWQLQDYPGELARAIDQIVHFFFVLGSDRIGAVEGAHLVEGIGLTVATVMLFRRKPSLSVSLPLALAASASLAALSSVLLWRGIGIAAAVARYNLIGYRVSGHVADVNAAGSYFAMIVCLTVGMAIRYRGRRRMLWLGLAATAGLGLWLSESRSALGAAGAVVVVAALWAATSRFSTRARTATLTAVLLALVAGAAIRARLLETDPEYHGVGFRQQFIETSVRMIGARPLFGIGEGQYYNSSSLFLSPQLAWTYGSENAHNFFLQVGGELGLVGLGLFAIRLGAAIARAARAAARAPRDARLLGTAGGVTVFLLTCLTGHPFLVGEVAYPFWIQFGLMTALAGSTLLDHGPIPVAACAQPPWSRAPLWLTAAAAIGILLSSPVVAARSPVTPAESPAVDGFYRWEALEDGTRFRWTGMYASLFVPADVKRVEIPIRLPTDGRVVRPMGVEMMTSGVDRGRTMVDATWAIVSLPLPATVPPTRFKRIDLKVDRVWKPALYIAGSADMRVVGVQVGEPRLMRD